ncbi:MAG: hypothetical protein ABIJ33_00600 [Patescibacteria group bacterium]
MRITRGWLAIWLLIFYLSSFFFQKISLVTADLGRHIQNGQTILEQGLTSLVLNTNYYSYTQPNYPVINHHWLYGVMAYLIHDLAGFSGLTIFNVLGLTIAIGLTLVLSARQTRPRWVLMAGLIALPLVTARSEIRPETISFLLFGLSIWLLVKFRSHQLKSWWLLIGLSLIQLIWVNTHIFFVFNIGLVGMFWLFEVVRYLFRRTATKFNQLNLHLKTLSWSLLLVCGLSLINPAGWRGAMAPLQIFDNYGYRVLENQSIPFLINVTNLVIPWYPVIIALLLLGVIIIWFLNQIIQLWFVTKKLPNQKSMLVFAKTWSSFKSFLSHPLSPLILIGLIFFTANFIISRLYPFTGLVMIPALSLIFSKLPIQKITHKVTSHPLGIMTSPLVIMLIIAISLRSGLFTPNLNQLGCGISANQLASIEFFNQYLSGPIYNNYDIGGFLIYGLFPQTKIYVDNRPEAYSVDFLTIYTKAQEKTEVWQTLDQTYNFQTIFFYRHDQTTWAQPFLIDRIKDPTWIPVFVDDMVLILVKNNSQNQSVIDKFVLPDSIFQIE